jgi:hypothetical protein
MPLVARDAWAADAPDAGAAAPAPATAAPAGDAATPVAVPAPAADAGTPAADATATEATGSLTDQVDTFWHYGKIGRYDLAADTGDKIVASNPDPAKLLAAFETVAGKKGDNIDVWMLRWRSLPPPLTGNNAVPGLPVVGVATVNKMKTVSSKLNDLINQGYETRRESPDYIQTTIIEMSKSSRAYDNNLPRLDKSGELAVKMMVDMLRNPDDAQYNGTIRQALRDLGRKALNPLLAATEMKDDATLVDVVAALGDIGYDAAIPYLSKLAVSTDHGESVRSAAKIALTHMGATSASSTSPASQFFDLAEKFYYNNSSISPSGDKTAYVWFWQEKDGLYKIDVPTPIFGDVMSMRETEYALKLDPSRGDAVSLWLAANSKREVELPKGAVDSTHPGDRDAHYYNTSAGVQFLNDALARAIRDRNAGVALKLVQSLQDIIGASNLGASPDQPISQALYFPNRQVRYEAAFALAESMPTQKFSGYDRVVPLLVEALGQTAKPNVLVVVPPTAAKNKSDIGNEIVDVVKGLGMPVASGANPAEAASASAELPAVDVIIISDDSDVQQMIELANSTPRLLGASIIVLSRAAANPFAVRAATDPFMNSAVLPPTKDLLTSLLTTEIPIARAHAGAAPLTDKQAQDYALRAAGLLSDLAVQHGSVFDITVAQGGVLESINDKRPEIIKAAGRVLSMLNSQAAQAGIANKAMDDAVPSDVRVSLFKSLANSAKLFGNQLDSGQVDVLESIVATSKDAAVRGAAAEARGALNLPSDKARTLILDQSKT